MPNEGQAQSQFLPARFVAWFFAIAFFVVVFLLYENVYLPWEQPSQQQALDQSALLLSEGDAAQAQALLLGAAGRASATEADQITLLEGAIALASSTTASQGASLLRQLSLDLSADPIERSFAAYRLVTFAPYWGSTFETQDVYVGPVWSTFLATSSSSSAALAQAQFNAMHWASQIYPIAAEEFWLAGWYSGQLLPVPASGRGEALAAAATTYIAAGDSALAAEEAASSTEAALPSLSRQDIGIALWYRAEDRGQLYLYYQFAKQPQTIALADVRGGYEEAIATLESNPNDLNAKTFGLIARLHYAYFLAWQDPVGNGSTIATNLAPLLDGSGPAQESIDAELRQLGESPRAPTYASTVVVAKADPSFKALLLSLGWSSAAL